MFHVTSISIIIFIAAMVNIFTAYVAWRRRKTKGGIFFTVAMMGIVLWTLAAALDYAAVPVPLKIFFAKLESVGYLSALSLMAAFALVYAGHEAWLEKIQVKVLLIFIPLSSLLLIWTNELHGLVWTDFMPSSRENNLVEFVHGPGFVWVALSSYVLVAILASNLLQVAITRTGLVRRQARLMLLALMVPVASNLLYLFNVLNLPGVDWTSITFSITGVLFLIALYGSRFMEIVPTARNVMIDQMTDGILVIDDQGRLVDLNPAALSIFGITQNDLWQPFQETGLNRFPEIIKVLADTSRESVLEVGIQNKTFLLQRIVLRDIRNRTFGQLMDIRDITEQKHAQQELLRQEIRFRQMIESAADAIVVVDQNGRIALANMQAAKLLGYEVEELLGADVDILVPARFRTTHSFHRRGYVADPQPRPMGKDIEIFARRKDGGELPVDISLSTLNTDAGLLVTAFIRDVTERKKMEEALHNRNNMLAALQQTMLDLVDRHEMDDILQTLLLKISSLLDAQHVSIDLVEDDELVTRAATPGQPLQVGDRMRHGEGGFLSWRAIETGGAQVLEDYARWSQRRALYENFPIHAIAIIPIHLQERVIGTINFSRSEPDKPFDETDIYVARHLAQMVALILDNANLYTQLRHELAERKQIQEVLRVSQENYMSYFNMGTVGMCVTSRGQEWIEVNDRLCQMLGYTNKELKLHTWSELTHPEDLESDLNLFDQILRDERDSYSLDKRFIRKDGTILYTSLFVSCQRYPDRSVRYFLASLVDITERVLQEQALRQAEAQLLEQQRAAAVIEERQRLARDLHDSVSQSIHSLTLFSETLTSMLEKKNSERALQISERLQESARQALKETRLMLYQLQPSELEAGRELDLAHEIEARLSSVEERAGVRASLQIVGDAYLYPSAWRENLFRITIEALNNSLKHAQARRVRVVFHCSESAVVLTIQDDGIGFDMGHVRVGGLGLRNMRERAGLLGGQLEIASRPGKGTRVVFRAEQRKEHEAHPNPDR